MAGTQEVAMSNPLKLASAIVGGVGAIIILVACGPSFQSAAGAVIWGCIWLYEGDSHGD